MSDRETFIVRIPLEASVTVEDIKEALEAFGRYEISVIQVPTDDFKVLLDLIGA